MGDVLLDESGNVMLDPEGNVLLLPENPPALAYVPASAEPIHPATKITPDSPQIMAASVQATPLSRALQGLHLPGCKEAKHAHYKFGGGFVGACLCLERMRLACGVDRERGGFALTFSAHPRDASKAPVTLWRGVKPDGDNGLGTYKRVEGLAEKPDELRVDPQDGGAK